MSSTRLLDRRAVRCGAGFGKGRAGLVLAWIVLCVASAIAAQAAGDDAGKARPASGQARPGLSVLDVELPLDLRARLDGLYSRSRYSIDALAYDRFRAPGPFVQRDSLLESRISLGREIFRGIEFELAWVAQTPLSLSLIPNPDRQTLGAFLRFTH